MLLNIVQRGDVDAVGHLLPLYAWYKHRLSLDQSSFSSLSWRWPVR